MRGRNQDLQNTSEPIVESSIETAKNNISDIREVAGSIVRAIKETRDEILDGRSNLLASKNSELLEFAIGKNKSIVPALNQLSQLLTRTITAEEREKIAADNNIECEQMSEEDNELMRRNLDKKNGRNPNYTNYDY